MELLLTINDINAIIIALPCFLLGVLLVFRVEQADQTTGYVVGFFFCLALAMVLENRAVYVWFDELVNYSNLAWVLGAYAKVLAIYFIVCSLEDVSPTPKYLHWMMGSVTITAIWMLVQVHGTPEQPIRLVANTTQELIFMNVFFGGNAIACWAAVSIYWVKARSYPLIVKSRIFIGAICGIFAIVFFIIRIVMAYGAAWSQSTIFVLFAAAIIFAFVPGAICIPVAHFSNKVMKKVVSPLLWVDNLMLYRDLEIVRDYLETYCPGLMRWDISGRELWSDPLLYSYQVMMDIFDRRKIIQTYLSLITSDNPEPSKIETMRESYQLGHWEADAIESARKMLNNLASITDNEDDFLGTMNHYRHLGISLRKASAR